jgi:thiamine-phosphate pyrophosphorylase
MRTLEAAARRLKPCPGHRRRLPRLVLFSDPVRLPDPRAAARRLPPGAAAVVARGLAPGMLAALAALARRRRLLLLVAGEGRAALRHRGAGLHLPDRPEGAVPGLLPFLLARRRHAPSRPPLTVAAHGRAGLARGRRLRADAAILSPVFPTESHPGAPALGPWRWVALARRAGRPVLALGGLRPGNAARLPGWIAGFAAIGALRPGR